MRAAHRLTEAQATLLHTMAKVPSKAPAAPAGPDTPASAGAPCPSQQPHIGLSGPLTRVFAAGAADPRVMQAKAALDSLTIDLPPKTHGRIYGALHDLAQKTLSLAGFATKLSYTLRGLPPKRRGPIEDAIGASNASCPSFIV